MTSSTQWKDIKSNRKYL